MHIDRFYPLKTSVYENMDQVRRCNSGSLSESDDARKLTVMDNKKDGDSFKKKHRRGRKRSRPKWKPYAKMSDEERKKWDIYEQSRIAQKEKKLAKMSRRPVAPFNTTQFLMEDRKDCQVYKPHPPDLNRCVSFDSSTSGEDSFELEDDSFVEQEAFLEADFNQVYNQLRMDRLEVMNKQDLVQECFTLEERIATMEQEKCELLKEVQELREINSRLTDENSTSSITTTNLPMSS